eukprot:5179079-Ditylum_brightwellii.AAC.2
MDCDEEDMMDVEVVYPFVTARRSNDSNPPRSIDCIDAAIDYQLSLVTVLFSVEQAERSCSECLRMSTYP